MMARAFVMALALCLLLTGCSGYVAEITGVVDRILDSRTPKASAPSRLARARTVTVQSGETLYAIAQRYQVSVQALIQRNHLRPPYTLRRGQVLHIPKRKVHIVVRGDTIYDISRTYGVGMRALVVLNGVRRPYTIYPGQRLYLPIPDPDGAAPPRALRAATRSTGSDRRVVRAPVPPALERRTHKARTLQPSTASQRAQASLPARSSGLFLWPVRGQVISGFGPKGKGLHNDGINIAAPAGSAVKAADNGVVVYAGSELEGFGNLILIKHAGGYITAYGHNSRVLVKIGDTIRRGQAIAQVGSSGHVDRPQLHFEVRRGKQALDPVRYLEG